MNTRRLLEAALLGIAAAAVLGSWLYVQPEPASAPLPKLSERPARSTPPRAPTPLPPLPAERDAALPSPDLSPDLEPPVQQAEDKLVVIAAIGEEQGWSDEVIDSVLALYASADAATAEVLADEREGRLTPDDAQAELVDLRAQLKEGLAEVLTEAERERLRESMQLPTKVFSVPE